jgi:hypothetical protein
MRQSKTLSRNLETLFAARIADGLTENILQQAILKMATLPHFNAETTGYLGDFAWLLRVNRETSEPNFRRVLNGDYEPRTKKASTQSLSAADLDFIAHGKTH